MYLPTTKAGTFCFLWRGGVEFKKKYYLGYIGKTCYFGDIDDFAEVFFSVFFFFFFFVFCFFFVFFFVVFFFFFFITS